MERVLGRSRIHRIEIEGKHFFVDFTEEVL